MDSNNLIYTFTTSVSVCDGAWVSARQGPARYSRASSQTDPARRARAGRERHTLIYTVFPSFPIQRLRSNDLELGVQADRARPGTPGLHQTDPARRARAGRKRACFLLSDYCLALSVNYRLLGHCTFTILARLIITLMLSPVS
jgi:hypothetical protein